MKVFILTMRNFFFFFFFAKEAKKVKTKNREKIFRPKYFYSLSHVNVSNAFFS